MPTQTQNRRSSKHVDPHFNLSKPVGGVYALHLTIGAGEKARSFGYYLQQIPADFGLGFHVEKFGVEQVEGEPTEYDVHIDTERNHHSCTCAGNTYHGHCKHVEAVLALIATGKIVARIPATAKPQQAAPQVQPEARPVTQAAPSQPWCEYCNDKPGVYCEHCSI
jgi:hypothetical protein